MAQGLLDLAAGLWFANPCSEVKECFREKGTEKEEEEEGKDGKASAVHFLQAPPPSEAPREGAAGPPRRRPLGFACGGAPRGSRRGCVCLSVCL